jgi:hypothetical protein
LQNLLKTLQSEEQFFSNMQEPTKDIYLLTIDYQDSVGTIFQDTYGVGLETVGNFYKDLEDGQKEWCRLSDPKHGILSIYRREDVKRCSAERTDVSNKPKKSLFSF